MAFNEVFAPLINSCGGLEYFTRISGTGGKFSSGQIARLLMTWLTRCKAGEKVSSIVAYSDGFLLMVSGYSIVKL